MIKLNSGRQGRAWVVWEEGKVNTKSKNENFKSEGILRVRDKYSIIAFVIRFSLL